MLFGDTLVSGGGVVEAARAKVRCAWAKFKELSPILTVRGASNRIKGRIYSSSINMFMYRLKNVNLSEYLLVGH